MSRSRQGFLSTGARLALGLSVCAPLAATPSLAAAGGDVQPFPGWSLESGPRSYEDILAAERAGPEPHVAPLRIGAGGQSGTPNETFVAEEEDAGAAARTQPAAPAAPRLNPSGRSMVIVAPLRDDQVHLGDVEVQVGADDSIEVSVLQVLELLSRSLDPSALEPMRPLAEPGVFAPLDRFAAAGLPITFDPRLLELRIQIAPSARGRRSIALSNTERELYGDFARPEPFSAYLNLRGATSYVHQSAASTGFTDPMILMDGAMRMGGVVFESEGAWDGRDDRFTRDGSRFVYDDLQRLQRWTLGDLRPNSRSFQSVNEMAGVGVVRAYSLLDPQRNVVPRGGRSFILDRESTVEAFVNGRSVRTIRLQPGSYDVSDFPFVQGSNDVDLVIVDDTGRSQTLSFSLFLARTQLATGLSEYGFYAGVSTDRRMGEIHYSDDFLASGFYRRGINEALTLGANFQASEYAQMVAGEAVWGSPIGVVGIDAAVSDIDTVGSGWAVNASYERLVEEAGGEGGLSLIAAFEARSRRFGAPGQFAPDNPYSYNFTIGLNRSFGDSSFVGLQGRYARGRGVVQDERGVRVSYGRRLTERVNMVLDADWQDGGFASGFGVRASLIRRFGATGSARAEYDSRSERGRVGYQTSGGRGVGAWSATANLDTSPSAHGLNAAASYAANRADLGLAHSTAYSQTTDDISDQRTSLRMGTSLAFAGGRFALGRPITDSFVIVHPYANARDTVIEVEPSPDGYYARSGPLGAALYGQLSAYTPRTVIYDAPFASAGFDVGQGAVRVLPAYRSGYTVSVGSDYNMTVIGRLLDADGDPVALLTGVAIEQGGDGRRVEVFTNRQGTFGAPGLKAGRWRIQMLGGDRLEYDVMVVESPNGIVRVGDLRPAS